MNIFDIFATVISDIINAMQSADFIYNISLWDIFLLFNIFIDIRLIIGAIFKKRGAKA